MDDECVEELGRPITSLKVSELRDELTKRALIKTGNKKELVDRLRIAIQRQSSASSLQLQQPTQILQSDLDQQHANSQYMNAAALAALQQQQQQQQQNSQLNQMQPTQLGPGYSVPITQQQQLHLPLDLQQQSLNLQNQVNLAPTQPIQEQQKQQATDQETPALDMTVPQPTTKQETIEHSIDLTNNNGQTISKSDSIAEAQQQQLHQESKDDSPVDHSATKTDGHDKSVPVEAMIEKDASREEDSTKIEPESKPETSIEESTDSTKKLDRATEDDHSPVNDHKIAKIESQSGDSVEAEPKETDDEPPTSAVNITKENDTVAQTQSISLKRGANDRGNSGKEKRRKWSSKDPGPIGSQIIEPNQVGVFKGGISSQKLQELIVEKQLDVKNDESAASAVPESKATAKDTSDNQDLQGADNSDDSKVSGNDDKKSSEDANTGAQAELKPKQSNEKESAVQEAVIEPTSILLVKNLVRPFTIGQLKEVLTKHGSIDEEKFWTDKVKSKCCVVYESVEIATSTKESLHGQQWPTSNPKTLDVSYITEETLSKYQKSEQPKPAAISIPGDTMENGNNNSNEGKSITDRLGQKVTEDASAGGDQVKKRMGDRTSGEFTKSSNVNREGDNSKAQELDDLFNKTKSVPHLFWLPLDESQVDVREKVREQREARAREFASKRRSPPLRRRSPIRHRSPLRHRSPIGRRSSPIDRRNRSRSPVYRRSSPRHRSPLLRRSPARRRSPHGRNSSPQRRRSPGYIRRSPARRSPPGVRSSPSRRSPQRSPGPIRRSPNMNRRSPNMNRRSPNIKRRSPGPMRRSPGPIRRSPGPTRRSPGPTRRSPGPARRSPGPIRRSPGPIRRSPGPIRRSPGPIRRSPMSMRRSPQLIRRSPLGGSPHSGNRGNSPRNRSPRRQRTPPRYISPPERMLGGFASEQRRLERSRF